MKTIKLFFLFAVVGILPQIADAQIITTIAGNGTGGYTGDYGPATAAQLRLPVGVVLDHLGNLYFSEKTNYIIRKVSVSGIITTIAGNGTQGFSGDGGPATDAQLNNPAGIVVDRAGNLFIADGSNRRVRKVNLSGNISTIAGNGSGIISGDGGPATSAGLGNLITAIGIDTSDNLFIAGGYNIRKIDAWGNITKVAGMGISGYSGDGGQADTCKLSGSDQISFDRNNNLYFTDGGNHCVRKITSSGLVSTVAGNGTAGYSGDYGLATNAQLHSPRGVIVDSCNNIYVSEVDNDIIRCINSEGKIYTIAGTSTAGFSGDGGPAKSAQLRSPFNLFLDKNNIFYIADQLNHRIRKIAFPRCDSLVFPAFVTDIYDDKNSIDIHPNPNDGAFILKVSTGGSAPVHVAIVTMVGATVQEYIVQPGKETTLKPYLPPGIYMVVAVSEKGRLVKKVVVR